MRFDDSLATVLAADDAPGVGAQLVWRQLVDLAGRGRVGDLDATVDRLRALRSHVPANVRAASARTLAWGSPPASLVAFFAEDAVAVAGPLLRTATLSDGDWLALLPGLSPGTRSVLRHRRDLPQAVVRGLASFGPTDFVLEHDGAASEPANDVPWPVEQDVANELPPLAVPEVVSPPPPSAVEDTPFVPVGDVARAMPVVAEAMRQAAAPPRSEIADLVARIEAFRREKPIPAPPALQPDLPPRPRDRWHFETDAAGAIRWVDGATRGPLIGVTLAHAGVQGMAQVDAAAGGALRARSAFRDVRLEVGGNSAVAGTWRLSGAPVFDPATGRFIAMAGSARRVERAPSGATASDSLRQLVHELRTPANAIAGFSELIGTALLGPVPPVYQQRAQRIQQEAAGLVAAIDDLDTAARLEGDALELRSGPLDLGALLARLVADHRATAAARGATLVLDAEPDARVEADDRAVARLLDRLLGTLAGLAAPDERLRAQLAVKTRTVRVHFTRPRALSVGDEEALLAIDAEAEREGGPLLGVGFTLRLVRNIAAALGGSLAITPDRLTLRLPAAHSPAMERAATQ